MCSFSGGIAILVGGFNPFEKYESKWESSSNRGKTSGKTMKYLKPPPRTNHSFLFPTIQVGQNPSQKYWQDGQIQERISHLKDQGPWPNENPK